MNHHNHPWPIYYNKVTQLVIIKQQQQNLLCRQLVTVMVMVPINKSLFKMNLHLFFIIIQIVLATSLMAMNSKTIENQKPMGINTPPPVVMKVHPSLQKDPTMPKPLPKEWIPYEPLPVRLTMNINSVMMYTV
eukprot:15057821-Ditylum_brightwellii.AAC.1